MHRCSHLQRAYNKYGADAFTYELVEAVAPEKELLLSAEQRWMDASTKLYNTCKLAGSPLGTKLTAEQRAKISKALKGKPKSPEHVEANRQAQLKVPRNEENAKRWGQNRLGTKQTPEQIAKRVASRRATIARKKALAQNIANSFSEHVASDVMGPTHDPVKD